MAAEQKEPGWCKGHLSRWSRRAPGGQGAFLRRSEVTQAREQRLGRRGQGGRAMRFATRWSRRAPGGQGAFLRRSEVTQAREQRLGRRGQGGRAMRFATGSRAMGT